jgi:electron transfer flavoprotein beta subunit
MIAACMKRVDHRPEVDALTGAVHTDARSSGPSDADQAALEWALRLGADRGEEVVAVTVGPAGAEAVLREALAAGAHRAVRVDTPTDAPSSVVAAALARALDGAPSVTFCGVWSLDRGSGSVPAFLAAEWDAAQALGLVSVAWGGAGMCGGAGAGVTSVPIVSGGAGFAGGAEVTSVSGGAGGAGFAAGLTISAERRLDGGRRERLEVPSPCVLSVEGASARLRRSSMAGLLAARTAAIEVRPFGGGAPAEPVRRRPYRPRARVLEAPAAGLTARERVLALTGAPAEHARADVRFLDPPAAADELLRRLRAWGYLP